MQGPLEKVKFQQMGKSSEGSRTGWISGRENRLGKGPKAQASGHMKKGRIVGGELGSNVGSLCNSLKTCWFLS